MKKPRNTIAPFLQKARHDKDISQADLAATCQLKGWDVDRFIIAKIESGSRCVTDFEAALLAECLRIPISSLYPDRKRWLAKRQHFIEQAALDTQKRLQTRKRNVKRKKKST